MHSSFSFGVSTPVRGRILDPVTKGRRSLSVTRRPWDGSGRKQQVRKCFNLMAISL
jgi:hypothetical protein